MSRRYRYEFTKKVHPEYIIFIVVKDKYVTTYINVIIKTDKNVNVKS